MGAELPLTCLLLALAIILIISVIVLAMHVDRLKRSVAVLGSNPVNLIELRHRDSTPTGTPKLPPPRPISGTCPWLKASMESVVLVPSRRESPKEVFLEDESVFVANIAACGTFELPVDNNNY